VNEVVQARISGFRCKFGGKIQMTEGDVVLTHSRRASA
jgi:hypothetical protein